MKKVVLAIDSFKGCLSSIEADKTAEQGIKIVCPDCEVISLADSFFYFKRIVSDNKTLELRIVNCR